MSDSNHNIKGNENVVIQDVSNAKITINYNGSIKEITNELSSLKETLKELSVQKLLYSKQVYSINDFNSANYDFVFGKRSFNEYLTKTLLDSLAKHNSIANKFNTKANSVNNWEKDERIANEAKKIIAYGFIGVIGLYLRKLIAIGKEKKSDDKHHKYIKVGLLTARRVLQVLNFIMLSKLWDIKKEHSIDLNDVEKHKLKEFFEGFVPRNIIEELELFKILLGIFERFRLRFPIVEIEDFSKHLNDEDSKFMQICSKLQEIDTLNPSNDENYNSKEEKFTLITCNDVELCLSDFLEYFSFLSKYKMVSIKGVTYEEIRKNPAMYIHKYAEIGIDSKFNSYVEKINCNQETISTNAILFFNSNYQENVNLYPFMIDLNCLTNESGTTIYFFRSTDIADGSLTFNFIEDDSKRNIVFKNTLREGVTLNELFSNDENIKLFNLDNVVLQFNEAKRTILEQTPDSNE